MPTVVIPALLRKFTGGIERVDVPENRFASWFGILASSFQESTSSYFRTATSDPSIAVSIDGEIATGGVLDAVSENSEVHFIPALGGGER